MRRLFYLLYVAAVVAPSTTKCIDGRRTSDGQQFEVLDDTQTVLYGGECDGEFDANGGPAVNNQLPGNFIPFDEFVKQVEGAKFDQYQRGAVRNVGAFEGMRDHILTIYDGVGEVAKSFVLEAEHVDCIDIKKQPSIRIPKLDIIKTPPRHATAPEPRGGSGGGDGGEYRNVDSPLKLGLRDAFGNTISCPNDTIPFSRITLEKLTKFNTLSDFLAKTPDGAGFGNDPQGIQLDDFTHLYAFSFQYVNNLGGSSALNIWAPVGDFSLSQQWYDAGAGSSYGTQTVEGGWVVYPGKFGTTSPVLFIFFTPDEYASGCYNLECPGFVQISPDWLLGGALSHSVMGGTQYVIQMTWQLSDGAWWLFLTGTGTPEPVGYYPTSLYNGGPMAFNAAGVKYGGEVVRATPGAMWPQMGSSAFPDRGFGYSAFQNLIYYVPMGGGGIWTDLAEFVVGSRTCWSIDITHAPEGGDWGTHFYYGGPGGYVCEEPASSILKN